MPDTQTVENAPDFQEQHEGETRPEHFSRRAAAIEAAYILEAVRG
jgi:hypothetical protein